MSNDTRIADKILQNHTLDKLANMMSSIAPAGAKWCLWFLSNMIVSGNEYHNLIMSSSVIE